MSAERSSLFFVPEYMKIVQNNITDKISELAASVLSTTNFFLVDVEIKGGNIPEVWVSIDAEDQGVNMDECAEVSNELSFLMDAHELFSGKYRINVSSPGLSRPLVDRRQYSKHKGRKAKVKYNRDDETIEVEGTLHDVSEEEVIIELNDEVITISFSELVETKIIPSFK